MPNDFTLTVKEVRLMFEQNGACIGENAIRMKIYRKQLRAKKISGVVLVSVSSVQRLLQPKYF